MPTISRNEFLKICGGSMIATMFERPKPNMLLSFSTLGCPDWTLPQIISFASAHNYNGVEIRGIQREMDLPKSKHFSNPAAIAETRKMFSDANLKIVDLGSSCELSHSAADERKTNLDEGRRFADLAAEVGCPYIRVFPNHLPKDQDRNATMDLISKGLDELGDHVKGTPVKILMETHGDLLQSADLEHVMKNANTSNAGLVWDVSNMWSVTHESPDVVFEKLKKYIFHTHIKDLSQKDGKDQYKFLGRGEVPIFHAIDLLLKNNYRGYYSFEWEKMWHPEMEAPEIAFADYSEVMRKHYQPYFHK